MQVAAWKKESIKESCSEPQEYAKIFSKFYVKLFYVQNIWVAFLN